MKPSHNILLVFVFLLTAFSTNAQRRSDERALRQRGNDSAWIYNPFMGATRFYLGTTRVTPLEFENTLRSSDKNINQLIEQARRKRTTALILEGGGLLMLIAGSAMLENNWNSYRDDNTTALLISGAGLATQIIGIIVGISAANSYRQGIMLFNYKARNRKLEPTSLQFSATTHGVGFTLKF
jgi:hypothetical protein